MQVRWATVLYRMVTRMKSKVSITVAWRPLYECVREAYMQPLNTYTGMSYFLSNTPNLGNFLVPLLPHKPEIDSNNMYSASSIAKGQCSALDLLSMYTHHTRLFPLAGQEAQKGDRAGPGRWMSIMSTECT